LKAICLTRFQGGRLGVDAEEGGIGDAISCEEDVEEKTCWPSLEGN
jgi:hypothetical protein